MSDSLFSGLVLVSKADVAFACKSQIEHIKQLRLEEKEAWIQGCLMGLKQKYEKAWFKSLCVEPTRENAEAAFKYEDENDFFSSSEEYKNSIRYRDNERFCKNLLYVAEIVGVEDTMWLTVESLKLCRFKDYV